MSEVIDGTDKFGKTEAVTQEKPAEVVDLAGQKPHMSGPAFCVHCRHEWMAIAPLGWITGLDCPSCLRYTGVFRAQAIPESRWVCKCGCDLYRLAAKGPMCMNCGVTASDWRPWGKD